MSIGIWPKSWQSDLWFLENRYFLINRWHIVMSWFVECYWHQCRLCPLLSPSVSSLSAKTFPWMGYMRFAFMALCAGFYFPISPSISRWIVISLLIKVSRFRLLLQLDLVMIIDLKHSCSLEEWKTNFATLCNYLKTRHAWSSGKVFFVLTSNNVLYVNIIWIHFRKHTGCLRKKWEWRVGSGREEVIKKDNWNYFLLLEIGL